MEEQTGRLLNERTYALTRNRDYYSFMLRLRQMQTENLQTWIVSMQNTHTGHQQVFSSLEGLIEFLRTEFGRQAEQIDAGTPARNDTPTLPLK